MNAATPKVLFVYYSYTQQAKKIVDAMAETLRERGCDVTLAAIEFTDPRYVKQFSKFPFNNGFTDVLKMLPAQLRRATGEIQIPPEGQSGDYDLIVIGSPTWWLTTSVPVRSFLKADSTAALLSGRKFTEFVVCRRYWGGNYKTVRKLGTAHGGQFVDGVHYKYEGGQVRSLLSLISYLGSGEYRDRYFGVKIPHTNLRPEQLDDARAVAGGLADQLGAPATAA
jgi:menaquinone-dependent protoporphyrinogen IX oxidase